MPVRLPLPDGFPVVMTDGIEWHATLVVTAGLPGTDVHVLLPNGYGIALISGRGYSGPATVEAWLFTHHGDPYDCTPATRTPVKGADPTGVMPWANGGHLAAALTVLSALDPII